ncbi:hypothetical protein TrRE_jg10687 [Triparma retinervis]|uniref:Uncharacterized protein n=1 Tax=Triparma retinervis TaxID=2557542 RepID=A0A9W6ZCY1_9STRA|nr:hypothetical protein TrRE_jg10687 [Triparma retinervis]
MMNAYPGRAVYQGTITFKKESGAVDRELDDWRVQTWDWEERKAKKIKELRPQSAPITNLKKSQRFERDRLSTPSRFQRLGEMTEEEVKKRFPGQKMYRLIKALPGEEVRGMGKVDLDTLSYSKKDPREKMCLLSVPKDRWGEREVLAFARNGSDELIRVRRGRVDRTRDEVREKIREEMEGQGAKDKTSYTLENVSRERDFATLYKKQGGVI